MEVYTYHEVSTSKLYVLMLYTAEMQPNLNSYWDQRRWNNQQMLVSFYSGNSNNRLLTYSPQATTGTIGVSQTISVTGGVEGGDQGTTVSLGFGVSTTTSYTVSEVPVTSAKYGNNKVEIYHNFLKYSSNTSTANIHCSHVVRNNLAVFAVDNYNPSQKHTFYFLQKSTFYRKGTINSLSLSGTITQAVTV